MKKVLLTVAGFDPSSGAGATLDLKVFSYFGFYGLAILTSVTVQNSYKVYEFLSLPANLVRKKYQKLKIDFKISGLKIGMLGRASIIPVVEEIVSENRHLPIVVDPVLRSSSGRWLLERNRIFEYLKAIKGKIKLITPNLIEASLITGQKIRTLPDMKDSARKIAEITGAACLIKGGHLLEEAADVLYDGFRFSLIRKKKLPIEVHGTGCFLSSAILCFLVEGYPLPLACRKASLAITRFLKDPLKLSCRSLIDL